jgi:malonate-semialdehyde dehydrogenase (acetylating)/methylmalonate-semialdehyde dehydrogenase
MKYEKVKNYYNGEFVESSSNESLDVVSPIDGNLLSKVPMSTTDELNAAVESAKNAFESGAKRRSKSAFRCFFVTVICSKRILTN